MASPPNSGPLDGFRILTCRQDGRDDELHHLIRSAGGVVVHLPLIEVVVPDDGGQALRRALARLGTQSDPQHWLACTSANGVAAVAQALSQVRASLPLHVQIGAVGPATAAAFQAQLGRAADLVPQRATAADLGEAFPPGPGRVLAPLAVLAGDDLATALRAKGYDVTVVAAYHTTSPAYRAPELADARSTDLAVLASPSAVERLAALLDSSLPMPVVAIGPRSAAAAGEVASTTVVESADTSAASVLSALVRVVSRP